MTCMVVVVVDWEEFSSNAGQTVKVFPLQIELAEKCGGITM